MLDYPENDAQANGRRRPMRIMLLGADGLLGTAVQETAATHPHVQQLTALGHSDLDITRPEQVNAAIEKTRPDAVINTAALMPADRCDEVPAEAYAVNALGPRYISRACASVGATPVFVTTDFVYDGTATVPYQPGTLPRPLLTYGVTKLAGEHETRLGSDRHLVVRTSCLFGPRPRSPRARDSFVDRALDRATAGGDLTVVDNVITTPTYTMDLAAMVLELLVSGAESGTYQAVNQGIGSWFDLCLAALTEKGLGARVSPTQEQSFTAAARPLYTPLVCTLPEPALAYSRPWRAALTEYLKVRRGAAPQGLESRPS
ncbi:NAD(P)-dependent oxidoreductase [Streptomyces sp. NBC_00257]|uniref:SDR family oxidoreductase n=1 Tax=unclassified Streptomyces TaxID=2593676 RepID=UPI00224E4A3E|nr:MULTISPECIES: NAD(P)-dependent oxidoreductase [unclassified Streptomyces]WTB52933.1 NAD(P)-dependent oxidoreductase [Streptomyces sp. NBC_00826]WTH94176.1 NAD(P)-dependent oxidoreductase [Streptomyces sp. NBC_00825]WTI02911.1 NAD(P)-dependent oxidoreductase [Streptomyces sp. NBC_00822]MCX4868567.1 NAD(P)-dependent oxidoreductase [Streptomyces sp. NBC_00906]MCX4899806.1 NAD(P)-dependent oxidoreductase [Streptomyces sp. NBC_00892]